MRLSYSGPATTTSYKGCLYAIGVIVLLVLAIVTYGLILIPVAIGVGVWIWYRRRQPASIAGRITKQALAAPPPAAVHLLNQAIEVDPHGVKTLRACADWFYDHHCWQDAAEGYGGILTVLSDYEVETRYITSLLSAGRSDDAIPRLEHLRSAIPMSESTENAILGQLATGYLLKGDVGQAMAFIGLAHLQKRNLDGPLQGCLYLRAVIHYLTGDRRHAVADLERLYALNPSMHDVIDDKRAMESGTFQFARPHPYPDWYPNDQMEEHFDSDSGVVGASSTSRSQMTGLADSSQPQEPMVTSQPSSPSESAIPMTASQSFMSEPMVSPDGAWRWDGTHWITNSTTPISSGTPLVSPDGAWRWDGDRWIPNVRSE
jgi:hypothetical protein